MTLLDTLRAQLAALLKECARVCENTPAPPASGEEQKCGCGCVCAEHLDAFEVCEDYRQSLHGAEREVSRLARELEEARGLHREEMVLHDAQEAKLAGERDAARAEAARSDMALRATLAAILLNKVVCQHEYPDRTGWRLHSLEAALEEAGRLIDMATEDAARAEEDEKDEQ
jgi:hypothetical protein